MSITYKDGAGIAGMRVAGRLASEVLDHLTPHVQAGITTNELDRIAHSYITDVQGTIPAPLNYMGASSTPYPKSICTSVNHVVCHGIPNDKALRKGDIVNLDITVIKDGWHGDTSRMFVVGDASIAAKRLCSMTYEAMWHGIVRVKPGVHLGDIGQAIQRFAEGKGFSVVREFCGHGIGRGFHEEPAGAALRQGRHARRTQAGYDLHHRTDDQCRAPRHQGRRPGRSLRRLDHCHARSFAVGAVGAHRVGHRDRL